MTPPTPPTPPGPDDTTTTKEITPPTPPNDGVQPYSDWTIQGFKIKFQTGVSQNIFNSLNRDLDWVQARDLRLRNSLEHNLCSEHSSKITERLCSQATLCSVSSKKLSI